MPRPRHIRIGHPFLSQNEDETMDTENDDEVPGSETNEIDFQMDVEQNDMERQDLAEQPDLMINQNERQELSDNEMDTNMSISSSSSCSEENHNNNNSSAETGEGTRMRDKFSKAGTEALVGVAGASIGGKDTQIDFHRRICMLPLIEREKVAELWECTENVYSLLYFCNVCGKKLNLSEKCCGPVAKFIRMPLKEQTEDLVLANFKDLIETRRLLKTGKNPSHNLNSDFFGQLWRSEGKGTMTLSLLGSIDGVTVNGHTSSKIWPISCMLLDLPTYKMQKATEFLYAGMVECKKNPSTKVWNEVMKILYNDVETMELWIQDMKIIVRIASFTGDQPAKRSLFGMKGHNSSGSCFFCIADETLYKLDGTDRDSLPDGTIEEDARNGRNGFGTVEAAILTYLHPQDVPIDLLHDFGEGFFDVILKEIEADKQCNRKSEIFKCDVAKMNSFLRQVEAPSEIRKCLPRRNGNDKIEYFRSYLLHICLNSEALEPKGRCIVIASALLSLKLYTGVECRPQKIADLTLLIRTLLRDGNSNYFTIKTHEILWHLSYVVEKFGNPGPLSTFSFETYYKFLLGDYMTSMTTNFCEIVSTRLLTNVYSRREIMERAKNPKCAENITTFVNITPAVQTNRDSWNSEIRLLENLDLHHDVRGATFYSVYCTSFGRLISKYKKEDTQSDYFFAKLSDGEVHCLRFIAIAVTGTTSKILCESIEELSNNEKFTSLLRCSESLPTPARLLCSEIISRLRNYPGVVCGKPSGVRMAIPASQFLGISSQHWDGTKGTFIMFNGVAVHA